MRVRRLVGALLTLVLASSVEAAPSPSFDWSVPPRYGLDIDPADGVIDAFTDPAQVGPATWRVDFDACASNDAVTYRWYVDGVLQGQFPDCDAFSHEFPAEGTYTVKLEVVDVGGEQTSVTHAVVVQDWLIIGLGDSYSSGEGNPDIPIGAAVFEDFLLASSALEQAQAALDDAQAALGSAQELFLETVAQVLEIRRAASTLEERVSEQADACRFPPTIRCPEATLRVAQATANLVAALSVLGLEDLIRSRGQIEEAVLARLAQAQQAVNDASVIQAGARAARDAARDQLAQAEAALRPVWQNRQCHRSAYSAQARAALFLEQADPRTSVTFIHLSCSGATIPSGLIGEDSGIEPDAGPPLPPQLVAAALLRGRREIDAVLMSIGGNDVGFGRIVEACIAESPCHDPPTTVDVAVPLAAAVICAAASIGPGAAACRDFFEEIQQRNRSAKEIFDTGIVGLPERYEQLEAEFQRRMPELESQRIYLTEYPNLLRDQDRELCAFNPLRPFDMLPGITRAEAQWAEGEATVGLNAALAAAASRHGWTFLGGIFAASTPHGYCAADPWLVRLPESFRTQGDVFGTVHPNRSGHDAHAELIAAALTADFYLEGDLARPRSPRPVCPGDCDGDGEVTVDELILGVAIGIGIEPLESCPAFDVDGDGEVTIDELLQAVSAVLGGC